MITLGKLKARLLLPDLIGTYHSVHPYASLVAGLGVAPSLEDYEPSVLLYTTPRLLNQRFYYTIAPGTWSNTR